MWQLVPLVCRSQSPCWTSSPEYGSEQPGSGLALEPAGDAPSATLTALLAGCQLPSLTTMLPVKTSGQSFFRLLWSRLFYYVSAEVYTGQVLSYVTYWRHIFNKQALFGTEKRLTRMGWGFLYFDNDFKSNLRLNRNNNYKHFQKKWQLKKNLIFFFIGVFVRRSEMLYV